MILPEASSWLIQDTQVLFTKSVHFKSQLSHVQLSYLCASRSWLRITCLVPFIWVTKHLLRKCFQMIRWCKDIPASQSFLSVGIIFWDCSFEVSNSVVSERVLRRVELLYPCPNAFLLWFGVNRDDFWVLGACCLFNFGCPLDESRQNIVLQSQLIFLFQMLKVFHGCWRWSLTAFWWLTSVGFRSWAYTVVRCCKVAPRSKVGTENAIWVILG